MQIDDFNWFIDNYSNLHKNYGTCYLVIKDKSILGSYDNYGKAVNETSEHEQPGTFIVQFCNGDESGYTNYIASNEVGVV